MNMVAAALDAKHLQSGRRQQLCMDLTWHVAMLLPDCEKIPPQRYKCFNERPRVDCNVMRRVEVRVRGGMLRRVRMVRRRCRRLDACASGNGDIVKSLSSSDYNLSNKVNRNNTLPKYLNNLEIKLDL